MKSTKPVDKLVQEAYQLTELAQMPMVVVFVDSSPASKQLVSDLTEIVPPFESVFKVYIADDPSQLAMRRLLGITWSDLPALAFNTLDF